MEPAKKKKYIEKAVFKANKKEEKYKPDKEEGPTIWWKKEEQGPDIKTRVVNVRVESLRKTGFKNLLEWL